MIKFRRPIYGGMIAALLVACMDQLSKWWIVHKIMIPPRSIEILPIFDIVLVFNKGISFGMLSQYGKTGSIMLVILAIVIITVLFYWLWQLTSHYLALSLGCVIGGALGNVIDRIHLGHVIDFIHLHWHNYSFPAFNIADTFITIGAILIVLEDLKSLRQKRIQ